MRSCQSLSNYKLIWAGPQVQREVVRCRKFIGADFILPFSSYRFHLAWNQGGIVARILSNQDYFSIYGQFDDPTAYFTRV